MKGGVGLLSTRGSLETLANFIVLTRLQQKDKGSKLEVKAQDRSMD